MKKVILSSLLLLGAYSYAQVGINTSTPQSTLDVTAKNTTGNTTNVDGLLIPRVDRQRAQSMAAVPTSTLIYVNNIATGTQTGTAANVDTVGYYYYDGTLWAKLTSSSSPSSSVNIYNTDGSLTGNRTVTQAANTLKFTGTAVNAFSVDGNSLSVDAANHRIGIGTATPAVKVDLLTATKNYGFRHSDGTVILNSYVGIGNTNGASLSGWWGTTSNHPFDLMTNDTFRMRIDTNGNVGIGTVTPAVKVDIVTNTKQYGFQHTDGTIRLRSYVGTGITNGGGAAGWLGTNSSHPLDLMTNDTFKMRISTNGNVGIGTPNPTSLLSVDGSADKPGGGSWGTFSDKRVKKDIEDFKDGLNVINQLRTVTYKYNEKSGYKDLDQKHIGFIAQEVEKAAPYMVSIIDDTANSGLKDKRQFDESALTKILVNAVKEQQKEIESLQSQQKEVQDLKLQVAELQKLLTKK
ncbi:tail fiber domain-containing protein [Chryseobacterium sp. ERMR1:04]|uniref:tail fiber domain-containing protein n=1 Tax=Chryseobacterium sp. ERMR1:04 TaxID=1705393 RepID=UPI0006C8D34F|nr:tail fiber domain-containing protein [Chryseobacterium sp. ERMR1:04]